MLSLPRVRLVLCYVLWISASAAHAGAMRDCVTATLSANRKILVLDQVAYDDPNETHVHKIKDQTFRVLKQYVDPNTSLTVDSPDTYWGNSPLWTLVVPAENNTSRLFCPYLLVTDDGEFLVLLTDNYFKKEAALVIYRRRDHPGQPGQGEGPDHGLFIRKIDINNLWPAERIPSMATDHTPQWYSEGSFRFSQAQKTLIYETPWTRKITIDLATGAIAGGERLQNSLR